VASLAAAQTQLRTKFQGINVNTAPVQEIKTGEDVYIGGTVTGGTVTGGTLIGRSSTSPITLVLPSTILSV